MYIETDPSCISSDKRIINLLPKEYWKKREAEVFIDRKSCWHFVDHKSPTLASLSSLILGEPIKKCLSFPFDLVLSIYGKITTPIDKKKKLHYLQLLQVLNCLPFIYNKNLIFDFLHLLQCEKAI